LPVVVPARPLLSMSIGLGVTYDDTGFDKARAVPAFFAMGAIGDGPVGFEASAFASQATGRIYGDAVNMPVDRLARDLLAVGRPFARAAVREVSYGRRVMRSISLELGPGLERVGRGPMGGSRFGLHGGAYVELPLMPAGQLTEVRVRLGVRRWVG